MLLPYCRMLLVSAIGIPHSPGHISEITHRPGDMSLGNLNLPLSNRGLFFEHRARLTGHLPCDHQGGPPPGRGSQHNRTIFMSPYRILTTKTCVLHDLGHANASRLPRRRSTPRRSAVRAGRRRAAPGTVPPPLRSTTSPRRRTSAGTPTTGSARRTTSTRSRASRTPWSAVV
jgi:hypothetical protein